MSGRAKLILIIVIIIAIIIIARRTNVIDAIRRLFTRRYIDYNCTPGNKRISDTRITYLDGLTKKLYDDIYNTPYTGHDCSIYTEADGLCDEEVAYIGKRYRTELTRGTSLVDDMNTQWTIFCDFDSLRAHLAKVGEV